MTEVFEKQFEIDLKRHPVPAWLGRIRESGIERFAALGFPTTDQEDWRYTSVDPIAKATFALAVPDGHGGRLEEDFVLRSAFCAKEDIRLVFVNGFFEPDLSVTRGLPPGVVVGSLSKALRDNPGLLQNLLTKTAEFKDRPFVALNTAFLSDGVFLSIPDGVVIERPIFLCHFSWTEGRATVSHPRNLIVAGDNSRATLVEIYLGGGDEPYFTNAVTEVVAGRDSVIDHTKIQQENGNAYHIASMDVHQDVRSRFNSMAISLGGALSRNEIRTVLDAEGAECALNGLYMVTGRQHVDNQTSIDHAKPHGTSSELYKGILSGQSKGVFNGRIIVRPDAQKTSARQTNKNLILSEEALVNTKPLLEIFANDVKCTHGATIGRLDENQVFYLRSRGMSESHARSLLTYAFASDIVQRIKVPSLKKGLEQWIFRRLLASEMVEEGL